MANLTFIGLQGASPPRELQLLDLEIVLTEEPQPLLGCDPSYKGLTLGERVVHLFIAVRCDPSYKGLTREAPLLIFYLCYYVATLPIRD